MSHDEYHIVKMYQENLRVITTRLGKMQHHAARGYGVILKDHEVAKSKVRR